MFIKRFLLIALVSALAITGFSFKTDSAQALAGTANIVSIWDELCAVHVSFYSDMPGTFVVELWDDGALISSSNVAVTSAGEYQATVWLDGAPGQSAPGVGVYLYDSGGSFWDARDPWLLTNTGYCGAGPDMVAIPATAVGGAFVSNADVYYGPGMDMLSDPLVTLEAGTTVWVLGPDATGDFYKILFAGKFLWVKAETLGPNYDEVWNGAPLPSNAVN